MLPYRGAARRIYRQARESGAEVYGRCPQEEVSLSSLHEIFAARGIARLWELREYGPEHELDLELFEPFYNGAEGYWTSNELEWLIYASHENSITFAGEWLVEAIREAWPTWREHLYRGWNAN